MSLADLKKSTKEYSSRSLLLGKHLEIGQKGSRLVVAGCVATFDFLLDLLPHAVTPSLDRFQPGLAGSFGGFCLPSLFLRGLFRIRALTSKTDVVGAGAQCADGS